MQLVDYLLMLSTYMIFDCLAMGVERQKHQFFFACGQLALEDFVRTQQKWLLLCTIVARLAKSDQ